eukprot:6214208-Pleurochrysis_carterae.AAC.2
MVHAFGLARRHKVMRHDDATSTALQGRWRGHRFQAVELVHHNDDILHLWWEGVLYPSTNDRDVLRASLLLAEADHDLRPDGTA